MPDEAADEPHLRAEFLLATRLVLTACSYETIGNRAELRSCDRE